MPTSLHYTVFNISIFPNILSISSNLSISTNKYYGIIDVTKNKNLAKCLKLNKSNVQWQYKYH
jgi:hypothetical protein